MKGSVRIRNEKYSYYFKYKDTYGKWKTKEKGGFATKKEAESAMRKAIIEFEESNFVANKTKYTLEQYIDYWFENVGELKLRYKTLTLYQNVAKNHINPIIGHMILDRITPDILQQFYTKQDQNCKESVMNVINNVLRNTFNLAVKQTLLKTNPAKQIEYTVKKSKSKAKPIDKETLKLLFKRLENSKYFAPLTISFHTGMRRGEALGLVWDCVDFENNTITIKQQLQYQESKGLIIVDTKTGYSTRTIQMTEKLHDYLLELKANYEKNKAFYKEFYHSENDFVCCEENGKPIDPQALTHRFSDISKEMGIKVRFHDLRHTHATMLLIAGVNIKVVQERLGHSNIGITLDVYSHITKELEEASIDKFNLALKEDFAL